MAATFKRIFRQDLTKPLQIHYNLELVFSKDNLANEIQIELYNGSDVYSGGGSVSGTAIRADGRTVPLENGTISGNVVTVALTEECMDVPGTLQVYVKLTSGDVKTTIFAGVFTAIRTETGTVIDPGTIIPSITELINQIDAAIDSIPADYSTLLGSVAGTYSASKTYAVGDYAWYNGSLYRCTTAISTAEAWTSGHWTAAVLSGDVSGLKSAIKWNDEATDMLDAIGSVIPFTSAQGGELWDNLISILRGTFVSHFVVWSGSNYTASNTSTHIADEASYSCTVTPAEGFIISALTVTMGNTAIVPTQNQDGTYTITIASVTDDVIIAVTTSLDPSALIYHVEDLVCDGTQEPIETPLQFSSTTANGVTEAWTLCATAIAASNVGAYKYVFSTAGSDFRLCWDTYNGTTSRVRACAAGNNYNIKSLNNSQVSIVITHEASSQTDLTLHFIHKTTDEYTSVTYSYGGVNALSSANAMTPLCIGAGPSGNNPFIGTINDITIHHRVLTSQEIEAYLQGGAE